MKQLFLTALLISNLCFVAFAQTENSGCPEIKLDIPPKLLPLEETVNFAVELEKVIGEDKVEYVWTVSAGKILSGQGTSKIEFLAGEENEDTNIAITVEIKGLAKNCPNMVSDLVPVQMVLIGDPYEELGKPKPGRKGWYDYLARLDTFVSFLEEVSSESLITIRFVKKDTRQYKVSRIEKIYRHFVLRKFDLTKITFAISESDYDEETVLWTVPQGAKFPKYVEKEYKIIQAENLEYELDKLFVP